MSDLQIKDGKLTASIPLLGKSPSKTGKSILVAGSGGFVPVKDEKGTEYRISYNVIKPLS